MILLDGKLVSARIREQLKKEVEEMTAADLRPPHLSAILVGEDPASMTYVNNKIRTCEELGFGHSLFRFGTDITEDRLLAEIQNINDDRIIDGLIVQLPLPAHISVNKVIETVSVEKDVDGFHPLNIGKMVKNIPSFVPATPKGILELIRFYNLETAGKHCVVVGRSQIVGTPVSILMGRKDYPGNCTVTLANYGTKNLKEICLQADILIVAIGNPLFVKKDMVKEGAVVIDVGMNSIPDSTRKSGSRLAGDVDFNDVAEKCSYITPVPGGVGLMTIIGLMQNTMLASKIRQKAEAF